MLNDVKPESVGAATFDSSMYESITPVEWSQYSPCRPDYFDNSPSSRHNGEGRKETSDDG